MHVPMMVNETRVSFGHLTIEFVDVAPAGGPSDRRTGAFACSKRAVRADTSATTGSTPK